MKSPIPDNEKALLQLLRKSAKRPGGKIKGAKDIDRFAVSTLDYMKRAWKHCPWLMLCYIWFYRICLFRHISRMNKYAGCSWFNTEAANERLEGLRFAAKFGRFANARGRAWALNLIEALRITDDDAALLIWNRTLDTKNQEIYFGHWDWISGFFNLVPVYCLVGATAAAAFCCESSAFEQSIQVTLGLLAATIMFKFSKAHSFDTFKVGSRYLKPNGLGITPHPATYN